MKTLLLTILLASCATGPKGGLSLGSQFNQEVIVCETGEAYYQSITVTTHWSTGYQRVDLSWQCPENDGDRIYIKLTDTCRFEQTDEAEAKCREINE